MRHYNFSAGPAALPLPVLERAQDQLLDWRGSGMSVMEMSHRGPEFTAIAGKAENDLRRLLAIPADYRVLFLQGGATSQFAMVPLNLLSSARRADYVDTGRWSRKAVAEAGRYGAIRVVASAQHYDYHKIPPASEWQPDPDADFLHYTANETIDGVEFHWVPDSGAVPLVADLSSSILSRPLDVSKFAVIYAGAQKNVGPAGLTLVIVREDLMGSALPGTPTMFDYGVMAEHHSLYNTPPTFAWYMAGLVFEWLLEQGGLEAMEQVNRRKAARLYSSIDDSSFYANPVAVECRSRMNVPFTLADSTLDARFLEEAAADGLTNLKGHRSVGGMRASLYNAVPEAGVDALIDFMGRFEKRWG
jgi:phosphoserine aminotransferase